MSYIRVWLPIPKWQTFIYRLPLAMEEESISLGSLVLVPLGKRRMVGLVVEFLPTPPRGFEIKEAIQVLSNEFQLSPSLFRLLIWAKEYYLAMPGEVLRTFFPSQILKGKERKNAKAYSLPDIKGKNVDKKPHLNLYQEKAVNEVKSHLGTFCPVLLHGVTGSGKTEVYLRLCEEVIARQEGVIVLVPEIALTPLIVGRFRARFGEKVVAYHSSMTEAQRLQVWREAKQGNRLVIIGTRSALGLSVQKLGLIIVDEEHDSSYKQEERFRYHARDMAVMRAQFETVPVLLGSATPSLESWENVGRNKYHLVQIPERATNSPLPKIELVDLKEDPPHPETLLSSKLKMTLEETLERKEQAILFLNRRGYSPFLICPLCGEVPSCPNCEISLTYHKRAKSLKCHYCDYNVPIMERCKKCHGPELELKGLGTERLEECLGTLFPHARIGRLDRDIAISRRRTERVLSQFEQGEIDILVGTQLISKGHDFRRLTLVGILLADLPLNLPDFRAGERVYQMVTQVAGRAGRHHLPGRVILQSFKPHHPAILFALEQDLKKFFVHEKSFREETSFPPFSRLILIRLMGHSEAKVHLAINELTAHLHRLLQHHSGVEILGPTPSFLTKLRGKYRWQVLIKNRSSIKVRQIIEENIPHLESVLPSGIQMQIDVDPVNLL